MSERDRLLTPDRVPLGRALRHAYRVGARHVIGLLLVTAALVVPIELLTGAVLADRPYLPRTGSPVGADFLFGAFRFQPLLGDALVLAIAVPIVAAFCTLLVAADASGGRLNTLGALGGVVKRLPQLLVITLVVLAGIAGAILIGVVVDRAIPSFLPQGSLDDVAAVLVFAVVLAPILPIAFAGFPAAVIESGGPLAPLSRVVSLLRGHGITLFGRAISAFALASIVATGVRAAVMIPLNASSDDWLLQSVGEAVADTVFLPLLFLAAASTYLDVRARGGALDREALRSRVRRLTPHAL